jgi:hypothetical protein
MNDDSVEIGDFPDEASAWLARAVLEANGIGSEVVYFRSPHALPSPRARLIVRREEAEDARRVLAGDAEEPSG